MNAPSNAKTSGLSNACAQEEADTLASKLTNAEIIAASWKDRATAEKARADRLAKALTEIADRPGAGTTYTKGVGEQPVGEAEHMAEIARAALQQETQP